MHGDHFFGLVGLISSFNLLGRKEDLNVYGPYEIKEVIEMQLNITLTKLNFSINYHVLNFEDKQLIYEDKRLEIFSFPLIHSIPTCGFLFKEKVHPRKIIKHKLLEYDIPNDDFEDLEIGIDIKDKLGNIIPNEELTIPGRAIKSYAYCSDTAYSDRLKDFFQDVNLLYHETSFMEDMRAIAEAKLHSTTIDAARAAMDTNAKKLMIGHFSARYKELDGLIAETKKAFKNTIAADESLKVKI